MVMLNLHKISLRPPWSIFIICQTPKIIFKSNKIHWKVNTIIYNFHVYTKGQFKTETCEKDARTRNMGCCQSAAHEASKFTHCGGQIYGNMPVFTQKAPISSTQIPNLIGNSTYVYSTA
ncbi:hypothetical protein MTR_0046s0040 [Medicago truncatula]|uniref:Uncharacterized protein n=1 Tax=Medicago truncatula TaxID=3880 RepID=A0A072TIN0_MEDTR|nr:hypothetical protein MTR_0046s0040 [Medicago truncatula]